MGLKPADLARQIRLIVLSFVTIVLQRKTLIDSSRPRIESYSKPD